MSLIKRTLDFLKTRYVDIDIKEVKKFFISMNKSIWKKNKSKNKLLVITQCTYPASIMEFMPIVKNIEKDLRLEAIITLPGNRKNNVNNGLVFESYGIEEFIFLSKIRVGLLIKALFESIALYSKVETGDHLLKIEHEGVNIGEPIYDTIVRSTNNPITIEEIKLSYFRYFFKAVYMNLVFSEILERKEIKVAFIVEEISYAPYGIFLRRLSNSDIKTYMQTYNRGVFRKINKKRESITIKINGNYTEKRIKEDKELLNKASIYMENRIKGISSSLLVEGYNGKRLFNRSDLEKIFKIDLNKKNVVLAVHCFRDAAHYSEGSIYKDYFVWMIETIKILIQNHNVNIFVKEHPAASFYKEEGIIADALKKIDKERVHFLPLDFNTASIIDCMDYVVTACGTMALEMSCFGIPGITTSKGYYYGFGIDINIDNIVKYREVLLNIQNIDRLSLEKQNKAKKIMYLIAEDRLKIELLPPELFYDNMEYLLNVDRQWDFLVDKIREGYNIDWFSEDFNLEFSEDYFSVERKKEN